MFRKFRQISKIISPMYLKYRHISAFSGICREIPKQIHQHFAEKMQISTQKIGKKFIISFFHSRKNVDEFWLKFWSLSGAKVCESCTSRQELSNEYLLAKIGVDTAENEPLKVWGDVFIIHSPTYSESKNIHRKNVLDSTFQKFGVHVTMHSAPLRQLEEHARDMRGPGLRRRRARGRAGGGRGARR